MEQIDLRIDYPSRIAQGLIEGNLDMGLVPVAVLPLLPSWHFVCDYGIACDGEVASVALFSDVPIDEVETICLDYQSRTSVALLKILLQKHWKVAPRLVENFPGEEIKIHEYTAALLIGDKALLELSRAKYVYDLGTAWKEMTGLPFVFAAWVSRYQMDDDLRKSFSEACQYGIEHIDRLKEDLNFTAYSLSDYYTRNIHFYLDDEKKEGMKLFLKMLSSASVL